MFQSFISGGFECSTHRRRDGQRLDIIASTRHDEFAREDYARLMTAGLRTARDGARWHLIEHRAGEYDFSSLARQARAARATGIQVIWDLLHYGYPDDADIFDAEFPLCFANFAVATAEFLQTETAAAPLWLCSVNEVSFFAWIAGEVGAFYPFQTGRGDALKRQLVRAEMAAIEAIRKRVPTARFVHTDPAIRVLPDTPESENVAAARAYQESQFEALDWLTGRAAPELGGAEKYLDVLGVNYYCHNQWRHPSGKPLTRDDSAYVPLREILREIYARYRRPLFIAETGIEDAERPAWFNYVCAETSAARAAGVPVESICLYPIVNHAGWDDERHCHNGLWDYPNEAGEREIFEPLAAAVRERQMPGLESSNNAAR